MVPLVYNKIGIFKDDYWNAYMMLKMIDRKRLEFLYWYRIYKCPKQERTIFLQQFIEDLEGVDEKVFPVKRRDVSTTFIDVKTTKCVKLECIEKILNDLFDDVSNGDNNFLRVS